MAESQPLYYSLTSKAELRMLLRWIQAARRYRRRRGWAPSPGLERAHTQVRFLLITL